MHPLKPILDADLRELSTFRLPARADELLVLTELEQLSALPTDDRPSLVLGGGSNTLFMNDWHGRVVLNRLRGISVQRLDADHSMVRAAAGESWHDLVRFCLDQGLYGLENLILIPGSVGAAPMQNIGAYGVELADCIEAVEVFEWESGRHQTLPAAACGFGYRDSHFRSRDAGQFLITAVQLKLHHSFTARADYASLADHLKQRGQANPTPRQLAAAVMRLRRHRLPDPARVANAGSFFHNPVVEADQAEALKRNCPELPVWPQDQGRMKLSAGWLIDQLGLRGFRIGDAGVYAHHALVLVNHGQATAEQLSALIDHIQTAVHKQYGLRLTPEPTLIAYEGAA